MLDTYGNGMDRTNGRAVSRMGADNTGPAIADYLEPPGPDVARFVYRGRTGALVGLSAGIKDVAEARKVVASLRAKAAALT
jgi:hypothetical protein